MKHLQKKKNPKAAMLHSHGDQVMLKSSPNLTSEAQEKPQNTHQPQCRLSASVQSFNKEKKNPKKTAQRKKNPSILALLVIESGNECFTRENTAAFQEGQCCMYFKNQINCLSIQRKPMRGGGARNWNHIPSASLSAGCWAKPQGGLECAVTGGFNPGDVWNLHP